MKKPLLIIFLVLFIDQFIKIYVKTTMTYNQEFSMIGDVSWAKMHFIENYGMAFGLELGGFLGKYALSIFRLLAAGAIIYYLWRLVKEKAHQGVIISTALIFAGAFGNIIDSAFYGLLFDKGRHFDHTINDFVEYGGVAKMDLHGYSSFMQGSVVDMFYFPLLEGNFPAWLPIWGGEDFIFFRPIFNFADASITVGVLLFVIFQRKMKPVTEPTPEKEEATPDVWKDNTSSVS
jgi:signal peptidase II